MTTGTPGPIVEISSPSLRDRLATGEPITLLDVRQPDERAFAAIPVPATAGDLFIPMREVPSRIDAIREALSRGPVVAYCHHGVRSMNVAQWLAAHGLEGILNLGGGIDAWSIEVDQRVPRYF